MTAKLLCRCREGIHPPQPSRAGRLGKDSTALQRLVRIGLPAPEIGLRYSILADQDPFRLRGSDSEQVMSVSVFIHAMRLRARRAGHLVLSYVGALHSLRAGNRDAAIIHIFNEVALIAGGVGLVLSAT